MRPPSPGWVRPSGRWGWIPHAVVGRNRWGGGTDEPEPIEVQIELSHVELAGNESGPVTLWISHDGGLEAASKTETGCSTTGAVSRVGSLFFWLGLWAMARRVEGASRAGCFDAAGKQHTRNKVGTKKKVRRGSLPTRTSHSQRRTSLNTTFSWLRNLGAALLLSVSVGCIGSVEMMAEMEEAMQQSLEQMQELLPLLQAPYDALVVAYPEASSSVSVNMVGEETVLHVELVVSDEKALSPTGAQGSLPAEVMHTALSAMPDRSAFTMAEVVLVIHREAAGGLVSLNTSTAELQTMAEWEAQLGLTPTQPATASPTLETEAPALALRPTL